MNIREKRKITVLVTGTRGIPGIQGGIETHCEELYPRLIAHGCNITITRRTPYINDTFTIYKGIFLKNLYAPRSKRFEAIIHTIISTFYARFHGFPIIHIHGIGPSLCTVFARFLGLKVVVTNHGPDYKRQKWGIISRIILRAGELLGTKFAHKVIAISPAITRRLSKMYARKDIVTIPNGIVIKDKVTTITFLKKWNLKKNSYILSVGRFVPEKGFHDLITAYSNLNAPPIKLVIAGNADHETDYSRKLIQQGVENGCVFTGFVSREILTQLYSHTCLFILPSYHEGLPFVLLEALSYGADVLVSDIVAHREFHLDMNSYFRKGDTQDLLVKINNKLKRSAPRGLEKQYLAPYNWDTISSKTYLLYSKLK